jgi:hypothetical protein
VAAGLQQSTIEQTCAHAAEARQGSGKHTAIIMCMLEHTESNLISEDAFFDSSINIADI